MKAREAVLVTVEVVRGGEAAEVWTELVTAVGTEAAAVEAMVMVEGVAGVLVMVEVTEVEGAKKEAEARKVEMEEAAEAARAAV